MASSIRDKPQIGRDSRDWPHAAKGKKITGRCVLFLAAKKIKPHQNPRYRLWVGYGFFILEIRVWVGINMGLAH